VGGGGRRALVAAPGFWWPLGALAPSSRAGSRPAASAVGAAAARAPPAATCGRVSSPPPALMPLLTHRNLRAAFQKVYAAVRRTSPASVAARGGAQLPSPMLALSCTHRSASSRVGRAPPVVASVRVPLVYRPCQAGSGICVPRPVPVHVHGGLGHDQTPAQGVSAGAVDTALATLGYGYAAYLTYFVISTYCAFGHQGPRANPYTGTAPLTRSPST
jgi:hypothetical protein